MKNKFVVTISPHFKIEDNIPRIMWTLFFCLLPAGIASIFIFGRAVIVIISLSIATAVLTEAAVQLVRRQKLSIFDGSAALTGLLLAYILPPSVPFWIPIIGSFFAVLITKQLFGGLGRNIFNPALAGRAFLVASWPKYMTQFSKPFNYDAITCATPLAIAKEGGSLSPLNYFDLFMGNRGGCIGEVCIVFLILGAVYLLYKGYISWHIPFTYIFTVGILSWIFQGNRGLFTGDWLFFILSGGLILGAFFMATDYVSSPLTNKGKLLFGLGCGVLTFIIRCWGGYPEGVCYSILMMNAAVPLIDRYIRPRIYGAR